MFSKLKNDFPTLYHKFIRGIKWLNEQISEKGRTMWVNDQVFRFERDVVAPMDQAWEKMTDEGKRKWLRADSDEEEII